MLRQSTELFLIKSEASTSKEKHHELSDNISRIYEDVQSGKDFHASQKIVREFLTTIERSRTETVQLEKLIARKLILALILIYLQSKRDQKIAKTEIEITN